MLSRRDKQNICFAIYSNGAYKEHFDKKEEEGQKFKDNIKNLLPKDLDPTGFARELFDMDYIKSKAGDCTDLVDKFRLFSGLRITKDQLRRHFREEFVRNYLIRAERARRESVKSLLE